MFRTDVNVLHFRSVVFVNGSPLPHLYCFVFVCAKISGCSEDQKFGRWWEELVGEELSNSTEKPPKATLFWILTGSKHPGTWKYRKPQTTSGHFHVSGWEEQAKSQPALSGVQGSLWAALFAKSNVCESRHFLYIQLKTGNNINKNAYVYNHREKAKVGYFGYNNKCKWNRFS